MESLINYIGVLGGGPDNTAPESGLYINQLPGITLKSIDSIANDEQVTWKNVWKDVQDRAARKFKASLVRHLSKRYKISSLKTSHCIDVDKTDEAIVHSNNYKGITIKTEGISRNKISSFLTIYVPKIKLYVAYDSETDILVLDVESGDVLFEKEGVSLPQGWNEISINKYFHAEHIFVCYSAENVDTLETTLQVEKSEDCACYYCDTCNAIVSGAISDDLESPANITTGNKTFGLTACFSVVCTFDTLVSKNKFLFVDPWMYCLGRELMYERLYSERLNRFTTAGKQQAQELVDHFDVEFESSIKDVVGGLNLDANDCCFGCETGGVEQIKSMM